MVLPFFCVYLCSHVLTESSHFSILFQSPLLVLLPCKKISSLGQFFGGWIRQPIWNSAKPWMEEIPKTPQLGCIKPYFQNNGIKYVSSRARILSIIFPSTVITQGNEKTTSGPTLSHFVWFHNMRCLPRNFETTRKITCSTIFVGGFNPFEKY